MSKSKTHAALSWRFLIFYRNKLKLKRKRARQRVKRAVGQHNVAHGVEQRGALPRRWRPRRRTREMARGYAAIVRKK